MVSFKEIIDGAPNPFSKSDSDLIGKAYAFAEYAHKDQKRYSGEPYFNHVATTAKILSELGMDAKTIVAGLLHDTLEDAAVSPETLSEEFGDEVLFMIEGVTKLGKVRFQGLKRHTESLRKLFVAMAEDLRILIIKLADRLHNMQTLSYVPEHKRERIALETLEIYAPLAYRLGIKKLHRELEDLSFEHLFPKEYKETVSLLNITSKEQAKQLEKISKTLGSLLNKENISISLMEQRIKGTYSLYKKLQKYDMDITRIYDVLALRVVVPTISDCYRVLGIIHSNWRPLPGRIKDFIAIPKINGYQSIHTTIFTGDGSVAEIQIRTDEMHLDAEYGIAAHLSYKKSEEKHKTPTDSQWLKKLISELQVQPETEIDYELPQGGQKIAQNAPITEWVKNLAENQKETSGRKEFMRNLRKDFFQMRIFVFTPAGDVVDLPVESSPIDFAYAIHSDMGNKISSAKINGKLSSIYDKLKNGDIVEIITNKKSHPSRKWLRAAKTADAKKKINHYILVHGEQL